jgi:Mg2+/Co2+ transporter CorB
MILKIVVLVILFIFSAFFSGSETALFSLDSLKLRKMRRRSKNIKNINILLQNPVRLLTTILIGNMLVNITASSIAASIAIDIFGSEGLGLSIGVMTFLLLIFGEVTPKRYAIERSTAVSLFSAAVLPYISKLFSPIHWILHHGINKLLPVSIKEPTLNEEELKMLIDIGHKEGVVAGHEKDLIGAVLGFTDTIVKQVMTKRENVKAISIDILQEEFIKLAVEFKHSKIPVYKNSLDNIMGVVYSKDLFLYPERRFSEIMKPVLFVSEAKKIKDVLKMFEDQNIKIAIVLDENGKTSGLITMEDILEEVFGEIYDEFEILSIMSDITDEKKV